MHHISMFVHQLMTVLVHSSATDVYDTHAYCFGKGQDDVPAATVYMWKKS